jgi:hypothetical protein
MNIKLAAAVLMGSFCSLTALAQSCTDGLRIEGVVVDPNNLSIPGARVITPSSAIVRTDANGHFVLPCVALATTEVTVDAEGFAPKSMSAEELVKGTTDIRIQLLLPQVETSVQISDDEGIGAEHDASSRTLSSKEVEQLADDPDDLTRELQALAATTGGSPTSTVITVDGFEDSSAMPPKGSIASIRINPDLFSSEYAFPPFRTGGHVDIITKVGAGALHGTLFFTDSDGSFNATDPFSSTGTPAGKRRYGFSLGGPIVPNKIGFNLALEKRDIDEFNVVNALTLDDNNNQESLHQTVTAPQRLWIASARGDVQITPKDSVTASFSANVNDLGNQGVGGLTLAEAGFDSHVSQNSLHLMNIQTLGATLVHESRVGYTWRDTAQTPLSTAPQLQVAGFFVGGGSTAQQLNDRERSLEVDDDLLYDRGKHSLKIGAKAMGFFVHDFDPNTFNGAFVFGGGSAPVLDANGQPLPQNTSIDALEQYRRARLNLAGGTPTTFQLTTGTPLVNYTQWTLALYAQDTIKLWPNLTLSTGFRYQLQTSPATYVSLQPRVGVAWALGKKSSTVLHAHAGLFNAVISTATATEAFRLNGLRQQEALVYSPLFAAPLTPVAGSLQVSTVRSLPHGISQAPLGFFQLGVDQSLTHGWSMTASVIYGLSWKDIRVRNINAPMVASGDGVLPDPTAALLSPRPIAPNENILQFQNSADLHGTVFIMSVNQQSYRRASLHASYSHTNVTGSYSGNELDTPQSAYTDHGESSRPSWQISNRLSLTGTLNLPRKVELSTVTDLESGAPFNLTTGTDANGDGDFNDRPSFASSPGNGVYATRFGLLNTSTVNGNVPRNLGTMPATFHVDLNVSRTFKLDGRKDSPRAITFNARSANLINHTNVTAVGTVVSSPTLGQSLAAESARRIELGARFSF